MTPFRHLAEPLRLRADLFAGVTALRHRRVGIYHDISWRDYWLMSRACAAALIDVGIQPGDRVGLLAENRPEWLMADMGLLAAGAVNVPPHAPLSAQQVQHQLADAGVRWLFLSNAEQWHKIDSIRQHLPDLEGIVSFDRGQWLGLPCVWSWAGFLQRGLAVLSKHESEIERRMAMADLATIMYTSGTTGKPKGVMLTHANLLSNAVAVHEMAARTPDHNMVSWLPYSHIYARTIDHYLSILSGVTLTIADSADTVVEQQRHAKPTHFSAVPRFYEKLLDWARQGNKADRLRSVFGPRVEWLTSGGAPLPKAIAEEYFDSGFLVLQGYGLTETSPVISFNRAERYKFDSVGLPIPGVEVRIEADGEILTRGPHVMKGYWNQADADIVEDGWLHTGDLGRLDDEGFLHITGRKKEMMVLSNGKKVMPTHLEGLIVADEHVDQVLVCGEGRHFLVALIVPNTEKLQVVLGSAASVPEQVAKFLKQRVALALANESKWEQVREVLVLDWPFSVEREELTVSLKMRRDVILEHYRDPLLAIYRASPDDSCAGG